MHMLKIIHLALVFRLSFRTSGIQNQELAERRKTQFLESADSLNGPDLVTELPFL